MAMKFKKEFLTFRQMKDMEEASENSDRACDNNDNDNDNNANYADLFSGEIFEFQATHP